MVCVCVCFVCARANQNKVVCVCVCRQRVRERAKEREREITSHDRGKKLDLFKNRAGVAHSSGRATDFVIVENV
jgi:hypothetical protein